MFIHFEQGNLSRFLKSPLPLLYVIGFTANSSIQIVAPVIPIFTIQSLSGSIVDVGYVVSAFYVASMVVKLPFALSSREQKTPTTLLLSCILIMAAPLAYRYSSSVVAFSLARFMHGAGFALLAPLH